MHVPSKVKIEKGKMIAEKKHDKTKGNNGRESKDIGGKEIKKAQKEEEEEEKDAMVNCATGDQIDR